MGRMHATRYEMKELRERAIRTLSQIYDDPTGPDARGHLAVRAVDAAVQAGDNASWCGDGFNRESVSISERYANARMAMHRFIVNGSGLRRRNADTVRAGLDRIEQDLLGVEPFAPDPEPTPEPRPQAEPEPIMRLAETNGHGGDIVERLDEILGHTTLTRAERYRVLAEVAEVVS